MSITAATFAQVGFQELSARERLAALFDGECFTELVGPFDRLGSPWLAPQGLVPQSDDGVVVGRGMIDEKEVVGITIVGSFEGGSIGEAGGAKLAAALELATKSSREGRPVSAVLLLETGGVRLQEATLGLASIAAIQSAIIELRQHTAVVAVIAGPVGCFGGMSLAAALCTQIVGTPYGRLGMNGPEVIEQEAGPDEVDAADREAVWQMVGCEARYHAGWIDELTEDDPSTLRESVRKALQKGPRESFRVLRAAEHLHALHEQFPRATSATASFAGRGATWLQALSNDSVHMAFQVPSILSGDVPLPGLEEPAFALCMTQDPGSALPRASHGELGLEQSWALSACIDQFVSAQRERGTQRPILCIVDSPGQAYGRIEEQRCISAAAASVVDAYARARRAGHKVITLVVGRAVSGSFLAHGFQSDHILALANTDVSMYAMSAQSIARITRRSLAAVEEAAAAALPMSFAIADAHRLGIIQTLIHDVNGSQPSVDDADRVKANLAEATQQENAEQVKLEAIANSPFRKTTLAVRRAMSEQWLALDTEVRDHQVTAEV